MSKQISLPNGSFTIVDDEHFEYLNQWKWCHDEMQEVVRFEYDANGAVQLPRLSSNPTSTSEPILSTMFLA